MTIMSIKTNFATETKKIKPKPNKKTKLINRNQSANFPYEIGQLVNLTKFCCANNNLNTLPSEIGQLVNLTYFDCSHNKLIVLPSAIGQLVNLTEF